MSTEVEETECPYVEDLDLSRFCISQLLKPNGNNSSIWTTKCSIAPGEDPPTGQTSFEAKMKYPISLGDKDKDPENCPTENRNAVFIVNPKDRQFIEKCEAMDAVGLAHFIENRAHYWGDDTTEKEVRKKYVPLIRPSKNKDKTPDGDLIFGAKLRPPVRMRDKKIIPRKNPSRLVEILPNGEEAEEPTSIDKVHPHPDPNNKSIATRLQSVIRFVCAYRTDGKCGISPHIDQGWFRYVQPRVFTRRGKKKKKRAIADVDTTHDSAVTPPAAKAANTQDDDATTAVGQASQASNDASGGGGGGSKEDEEDQQSNGSDNDDNDDVEDDYDDTADYE